MTTETMDRAEVFSRPAARFDDGGNIEVRASAALGCRRALWYAATASFPTRSNIRETGDLTLTASVHSRDGYWMAPDFTDTTDTVTVTDDDTAPEVSLSVSPAQIREGEDVTFTVTRHGDTSEALEVPFALRIGPSTRRFLWPTWVEPQDYGVAFAAGESSTDLDFTVHYDGRSNNFRYEAQFMIPEGVPDALLHQYLNIRGDREVSASVRNRAKQEITFESIGSSPVPETDWDVKLPETFYEGQQVPFVLERSGTTEQLAGELTVTVRYFEPDHPERRGSISDRDTYYNPSEQNLIMTFPERGTRLEGQFVVAVDDDDAEEFDRLYMSIDRTAYSEYHTPYYGVISGFTEVVFAGIQDNPRAVSIVAVDNTPVIDGEPVSDTTPTIEEGGTAEFTLTRLGLADEVLTVNVNINDPGNFRRGNHWQSTPDRTAAVTFAEGATTTSLSVPTRDDNRDIPNNSIAATVPSSQDGSYRPARADEGGASASFTVTDNDTAPVISLSVSPATTTVEEGNTATFTVSRVNTEDSLDLTLLYGPQGSQEENVYTFEAGESELEIELAVEDDDYDDPDERVYELSLPPLEGVPEDERSQYWTVDGASSVTATVTDNDLPLVWVELVESSYREGDWGQFRLMREGQTSGALVISTEWFEAPLPNAEEDDHVLFSELPYWISENQITALAAQLLARVDGDEGDGIMEIRLVPNSTNYRIDTERSSAYFTVIDTDPTPTLYLGPAVASESDGEVRFGVFVLSSPSPPSKRTITVDFATRNGTAVSYDDFTPHTGTLTIEPEQTFAYIVVPLVDDRLSEVQESFTLVVSNPVHALLQDGEETLTVVGTINDDEPLVSVVAVDDEIDEGDEAVLEFTRTGSTAEALTIYFYAGYFDGRPSQESIEIPAGQRKVRWSFTTEEDDVDGPDVRYGGYVVPPDFVGGNTLYYNRRGESAWITVRDDDLPVVTIEATNEFRQEGSAARFNFSREGLTEEALTVNVSVTNVGDFFYNTDSATTTATFPAGSSTTSLSWLTREDNVLEDHGSITVAIAEPSENGDQYRIGDPASAMTGIRDDDRTGVSISIARGAKSVDEGEDVEFILTRAGGEGLANLTIRVNVVEVRGVAAGQAAYVWDPESDEAAEFVNHELGLYSDTDHNATFDAGPATATLSISTENESHNDGNSFFKATLPLSGNYRIDRSNSLAVVWVRDDDIPTVTIAPESPQGVEGRNDDGTIKRYQYVLTRTGNTDTGLGVDKRSYIVHHYLTGDERIPGRGWDEGSGAIKSGMVSSDPDNHAHNIYLRLAPIDGAVEYGEVVPFHCEEVPGDCGTRPQYRVGSPGSYSFTLLNDATGVRIEADQDSVTEGETATFTVTRFGGNPAHLKYALTLRAVATVDGEIVTGTLPQTVYFAGIPDVPLGQYETTKPLSITTLDDDVFEADGSIEIALFQADELNDIGFRVGAQFIGSGRASVVVEDDDQGAISIADATASESDDYIEFSVTVPATYEETTVDWATSDGTAAAGSDYEAASGELVFEPGDTSKTIRVMLTDDTDSEGDETLNVTLSNPTVATLATSSSAVGTIEDDDGRTVMTVTASSTSVEEGGVASFTFSRGYEGSGPQPESFGSQPLAVTTTLTQQGDFFKPGGDNYGDTEVDYDADDGTATFTIPGGQLSFTLNLTTDDDAQPEADGSIKLTLSDQPAYDVGSPASSTVAVIDNDVGISISNASGNENVGSLTFTVTLSRASEDDVTVRASTEAASATDNPEVTSSTLGRDYHRKSETLTFSAGDTEKEFSVTVVDDTIDEPGEENFRVVLTDPSENASILKGTAEGQITDNDEPLMAGVYREARTVYEDAEGPVTFRFELKAQEGSETTATEFPASVRWTVTPATAIAGEDYTAPAGVQTTFLPRGVLTSSVEVDLVDDDLFEKLDETFTFEITGFYKLVAEPDRQGVEITIRDDDVMQADVAAVYGNVTEGEDATFRVTLTPSVSTEAVEVTYTVVGTAGTADYVAPSGTLTIPEGESSGTVTISTVADDITDPDETLRIQLTRATSNQREVTIVSRDDPSVTTILELGTQSVSIVSGDGGVGGGAADEGDSVEFTVRLSDAAEAPVRVNWATEDGKGSGRLAIEGEDYTGATGTVTILTGNTSATFTVVTLEDSLYEGNETFVAKLTAAKVGDDPGTAEDVPIAVSSATGTINDGDVKPTIALTVTPASISEGDDSVGLTVTATFNGASRLPDDLPVRITLPDHVRVRYFAPWWTGTLTILAGQASRGSTMTFFPLDDEVDGADRQEEITGSATGFEVTPATLTISDDDGPPTGIALSVTPGAIDEGEGEKELVVTGTLTGGNVRSVDTEAALSVEGISNPPEEEDGDASVAAAASDFTASEDVTLTIPAGQRTGTTTVTFTPIDDILAESDETARVTGTSSGLTVTPAPLTIEDNDDEPNAIRLSISPPTVGEGDGETDIEVTATLEGGTTRTAATMVVLSVEGVTATNNSDFTATSSVELTIGAGQASAVATVSIIPVDDDVHEVTEQVAIRGTNADPGLPVRGTRVSITDDDATTGITLAVDDDMVSEDGGPQQRQVTATLQGSTRSTPTSVRLELRGLTAQEHDFSPFTTMLNIPPTTQQGTATVLVLPTNDALDEDDETLEVRGSTSDLEVQAASVTITDDDTAGLIITPTPLTVTEGDTDGETYTVKLATQPTAAVTVTITGQADTDLTLTGLSASSTLTFSTTTWDAEQTVTVTAVGDADGTDDTETLTHTATGGDYAGKKAELSITVDDDDTVGIVLNKTTLPVTEGDATGSTYTVKLATQPTAAVTVTVSRQGNTDLSLTGVSTTNTLTFTEDNWATAQTVTVKAAQDDDGTDEAEMLTHTATGGDYAGKKAELLVNIDDDETIGIVLSRTSLTVTEGDTAGETYTVKLGSKPTEDVTVTVSGHADTDLELTGVSTTNTLSFSTTTWDRAQTVTVKAAEDDDGTDDMETLTHTAAGGDYAGKKAELSITVDDDDTVGIVLNKTTLPVTEGDTTGASYTVKLATQPTEDVTVTVSGHADTDLELTGVSATSSLTFSTTTWDTAQTVTVKAGEDDDGTDEAETLAHTASGGDYAGKTADLLVNIDDDETIEIVLTPTSLTVTEGDADGETYTVKLATQPTAEVTVRVSGHADTDLELTGVSTTNTLTFSTTTWDTAQTVTVKAAEDDDGTDDMETLTHTASGGDYGGKKAELSITVDDDDTVGIVLSTTTLDVLEDDATGSTYTVKLATQPTAEVTVTVSGHAGSDLTLTGLSATSTLTFTEDTWNTAQTVTVKADGDVDATDDTETLVHTAEGGDYAGKTADLLVNIDDDDTVGIVLARASLTVNEGDTTGETYTVKLGSQPTAAVTVTITGQADTDLTLTGLSASSTLTFSTTTWDAEQTVTVTAVGDADGTDDTETLTHTATGGDYAGKKAELSITVDDDDTVGIVLNKTTLPVTEGDATGSTYTVKLATQPTAAVTVTVSRQGNTDLSLTGVSTTNTLTFTEDNWATAQTVTVKAAQDDDGTDEAEMLTHTATGGDYAGKKAELLVNIDDDETIGIVLSRTSLTVTEGDTAGETYTVKLGSKPTEDVTVTVSGHADTDLELTGVSTTNTLSFSTTTWDRAQTVTVKAVGDDDGTDDTETLTHTAAGGDYAGKKAELSITVDDDDTVGIVLSPTSLPVTEGDTTGETYTVKLTTQPSEEVTVEVTGQADTDLTLTGLSASSTLTFTEDTWDTAQTVTVTAVGDDDATDDTETLTHTAMGGDYAGEKAELSITVDDDDTVEIVLSKTSLTVTEGDTTGATYTVKLGSQPAATTNVTVNSDDHGAATTSASSLTFTASTWNIAQTVTVSGVEDDDDGDERVNIGLSASGGGYSGKTASVSVTVTDDDHPRVSVSFEESTYTVAEGSSVTVTLTLSAAPERSVEIPITRTEQAGASSADYSGVPSSVTFSATSTSESFTFRAIDDDIDDDGESVKLVFGTLPDRVNRGATTETVISITDDDTVNLVVDPATLTVAEGVSRNFTVKLATQPTATTTVTVNSDDHGAATTSPSSRTFTTSTWNSPQTVTVSGVEDDDDGDERVNIGLSASGGGYSGKTASVSVTVTDDDHPRVSVSFEESTYTVAEGAETTVNVVLSTNPERPVTIPVIKTEQGGATTTDYSGVPSSVTFSATSTSESFTFRATDDDIDDDGESVKLVFGTLPDRMNRGSTTETVISITDDDTVNLVVDPATLTVAEGVSRNFTVKLATQPTATTTVTVNSDDHGAATTSPSSRTFTTSTWNSPQTVTVSGVDDSDTTNETVTINLSASGGDYDGVNGEVAVTVTDDDTANLVVDPATLTVGEAGSRDFTVKLATLPTATTTVTVNSDDHGAATTSVSSLTFTTSTWNTSQTVTVSGVADEDDGDESVSVDLSATGGGYSGKTASVSVTVTDDDHPRVSVSFEESTYTVAEGSSVTVTLTLSAAPERSVEIPITRFDPPGVSNADYTGVPLRVTFSATSTSESFTFRAIDDDIDDDGESVRLVFGTLPDRVNRGATTETVISITDDDTANLVVDPATLTVGEAGSRDFTVKLVTLPTATTTVTVNSDDHGAATTSASSLTFTTSTWNTSQTVTVSGVDDSDSTNETVTIDLSAAGGGYAGVNGEVAVTVTDDDDSVLVNFDTSSQTIYEGSSAAVQVTLTKAPTGQLMIPIEATESGGASSEDYSGVPSSLTFEIGETSKSFTVRAEADTEDESGEAVTLTFGGLPDGVASGAVDQTVLTLEDLVLVSFDSATYVATEGGDDAVVTVQLSEALDFEVTVVLMAEGGGGATIEDWTGVPDTVTFLAGETTKSFTVVAVDDTVEDDGEMVHLRFETLPPSLGPGSPDSATITLMNDEVQMTPSCSASDVWCATLTLTAVSSDEEHDSVFWAIHLPTWEETQRRFDYGGVTYEANYLRIVNDEPRERVSLSFGFAQDYGEDYGDLSPPSEAHTEGWMLSINNIEFSFDDVLRRIGDSTYTWWSRELYPRPEPGTEVTVRIVTTTNDPLMYTPVRNNRRPTGELVVNGVARVGETLSVVTSDISDPEGMDTSTFNYYWMFVRDDTKGSMGGVLGPEFILDSHDEWKGHSIFAMVTFTDDAGRRESVRSEPMSINWGDEEGFLHQRGENTPATGAPGIQGIPLFGETLTATTYGIEDQDGLDNVVFNYQWIRIDLVTRTDTIIEGATDQTYTMTAQDAGKGIRVRVTFTDDLGNEESLESPTRISAPRPPNSPASGVPTISGTVQVGETLMADPAGVTDADGVDNATFEFQWIRGDGNSDTDIANGTGASYLITTDDVGSGLKVRMSYTDDAGYSESVTSTSTVPVTATVPGQPRSIGVQPAGDGKLSVTWDEPASDGGASITGYAVQWKEATGNWDTAADVSSAVTTETTYTTSRLSVGTEYSIRVIATNSVGNGPASAEVSETAIQNTPPTGAPAISGTAQEGATLTADASGINDADGLDNVTFSYQWVRDADSHIAGATSSSYELVDADVGKSIKVRVTFTDDADNEETLTSEPTAQVEPATGPLTGFTLVDTSDQTVLGTLENDDEVRLADPAGGSYGIRADTKPGSTFGSIKLDLTGARTATKIENLLPYSLFGDYGVNGLKGQALPVGSYTLTATAYSDEGGEGDALGVLEISFTVAATNTPAKGRPSISGTVKADRTLTVQTSGITDRDGLTNVSYSYQWITNDGNVDAAVEDATGSTYDLSDDDIGKTIKVRVSFTDDANNEESRTSRPTVAVGDRTNSPATGAPTINGTARVGQVLSVDTSDISDDDGLDDVTFSYQWISQEGGTDSEIVGATSSSYSLDANDLTKSVRVRVTFTDAAGYQESLISQPVGPVDHQVNRQHSNSPATGAPTITGTAQVGETLSADTSGIADDDGLDNVSFSYQWLADGDVIAGATGSSYTVADAEEGKTIKVRASFTDDAGNEESLTSGPTSTVAARPNSPATGAPTISGAAQVGETLSADTSGIVDDDGLDNVSFSYQWLADGDIIAGATGSSYTVADADVGKTITVDVTFTDDAGNEESLTSAGTAAVAAQTPSPPSAPQNLTAVVNDNNSITLSWDAPDDDSVTGYQVLRRRPKEGEDTLLVYVEDTGSTSTTYTDSNVTAGTQHVYRVKAINAAGAGGRSNYVNVDP